MRWQGRRHLNGILLSLLYLSALLLRLRLWHVPPYGDEGLLYYAARHFWTPPDNLHTIYFPEEPIRVADAFFRRPLYALALTPGALLGFEGHRLLYMVYTSFLPVLLVLVIRAFGARPLLAFGAGLTAAVHPSFVVWGSLTMPDSTMCVAFLAGLLAHKRGRPWVSSGFMLLAVWTKETALVPLLVLWCFEYWKARRRDDVSMIPLRLTLPLTLHLGVLVLSLVPTLWVLVHNGAAPGGPGDLPLAPLLDSLFLVSWAIPVVLLGLGWHRTRLPSALALAVPVFYVVLVAWFGRGMNIWYYTLPQALVLVGAALVVDQGWTVAGRQRTAAWRAAPGLVAAIVFGSLFLYTVMPSSSLKADLTKPLSQGADNSIEQAYWYEDQRDADMVAAFAHMRLTPSTRIVVAELYGAFVLYPLAERAGTVWIAGVTASRTLIQTSGQWVPYLEESADYTLIEYRDEPLYYALKSVYRDCITFEEGRYVVIEGVSCPGRGTALDEEYARQRNATAAPPPH